jgi:hypothetical protein
MLLRFALVRSACARVGRRMTPLVPDRRALLEQCDVLVVRHRSILVPIPIFSGVQMRCKAEVAAPRLRRGRLVSVVRVVIRVPLDADRDSGSRRAQRQPYSTLPDEQHSTGLTSPSMR